MSLKFSEKAHRYWLDGVQTPGVTTLIGKGLPKPAIPYWAAKSVAEYVADNEAGVEQLRLMGREPMVGALKGVPWAKRDEAAVRGTDIHALAEELVHGREVLVPEHLTGFVEGYARWLDEWDVTPHLTEKSCANRKWGYCGRFDFIGSLGAGPTWCLDWKTSKGIYGETALQTAAYANAEFYVDDDDPNTEHLMPFIDRIGVVHITAEGTSVYDLGNIEPSFKLFTHIQHVAKRAEDLKGLIGQPMEKSA